MEIIFLNIYFNIVLKINIKIQIKNKSNKNILISAYMQTFNSKMYIYIHMYTQNIKHSYSK